MSGAVAQDQGQDYADPGSSPVATPTEVLILCLAAFDITLTHVMVVRGPAVEIGLGATHLLAAGGTLLFGTTELLVVASILLLIRWVERRDGRLALQLRGTAFGFLAAMAVWNISVVYRAFASGAIGA